MRLTPPLHQHRILVSPMQTWIEEILGPGGEFARRYQEYEFRPQQLAMASAIAEALEGRQSCIVEAGTGVGKTVAYLVPAIMHSLKGKPVVISTHTINLQGQLMNKDIPMMREVMHDTPFKAILVKGRANFLCHNEMDHARADIAMQGDPLFERLEEWAQTTETGDISELDFTFPTWSDVCSNQDTCRHMECPYINKCFYYKMRRMAAESDIIVVNHALFFSDLGIRLQDPKSSILPEYDAVIFDEAHHLEDVAGKIFGIEISNYRVNSLLNRIRKRKEIAVSRGELQMIETANNQLFDEFGRIRRQEFFLDEALDDGRRKTVEDSAKDLVHLLDSLNTQLSEQDAEGQPELKDRIDGYRRMMARLRDDVTDYFFKKQPRHFRWCEKPSAGKFVNCCLHLTPVDVAGLLQEALWNRLHTAVLTSATLSNSGGFGYIKGRLGLERCREEILGSPFNFQKQSMLYVPRDLPEPTAKGAYEEALCERIKDIIERSDGRAFCLFTSYRMMNLVHDRLRMEIPYPIFKQGEMSNDRLLSEFLDSDNACLFGVHSFWEGVDVRGEKLSCVIIDKLPFAVPDSPINKARCDAITNAGGDWFREYAMPQAQIRLKQGFGRLIRTHEDCGVVCILDSRILKKFYGKEFLRYLPKCRGTTNIEEISEFFVRVEGERGSGEKS